MADNFAIADAGVKEGGILSATAKWHEQQSIRTLSKSIARSRDKEEYGPPDADSPAIALC